MSPAVPHSDWKTLFPEPVAVLGYGVEGRSTLRHLMRRGYRDLVVLDKTAPSEGLPEGVRGCFGAGYLGGLDGVRTAFRAPGLRPFVPEIEAFAARGGILTSQVEAVFALRGGAGIVGVTGTVGKGTCCSLLAAMLAAAGRPHVLAGNIGLPPLDGLEELDAMIGRDAAATTEDAQAVLLLELSSFQLATLRASPAGAVVLRTTTEHLDWHATRDEYWDHKANLVRFQKTGDFCVYHADAPGSAWIGTLGAGRKIPVGVSTDPAAQPEAAVIDDAGVTLGAGAGETGALRIPLAATHLTGAFNLENLAAAAAAARALGVSREAVDAGARAFAPLEHRLEFVRAAAGRRYFNDSYATRPEAALAAVGAFAGGAGRPAEPLGLILGGSEKFADFAELAAGLAAADHLRAVALIGQTAARLEDALRAAGALAGRNVRRCEGLEDAVEFLRREIASGVILLAPACASFGIFANYKERGKAFKKLVNALPG